MVLPFSCLIYLTEHNIASQALNLRSSRLDHIYFQPKIPESLKASFQIVIRTPPELHRGQAPPSGQTGAELTSVTPTHPSPLAKADVGLVILCPLKFMPQARDFPQNRLRALFAFLKSLG